MNCLIPQIIAIVWIVLIISHYSSGFFTIYFSDKFRLAFTWLSNDNNNLSNSIAFILRFHEALHYCHSESNRDNALYNKFSYIIYCHVIVNPYAISERTIYTITDLKVYFLNVIEVHFYQNLRPCFII